MGTTCSLTIAVTVEPQALALINQVAAALDEAGLDEAAEEMLARMREKLMMVESAGPSAITMRLRPFAELALRDVLATSERASSTAAAKTMEIRGVLSLAGY